MPGRRARLESVTFFAQLTLRLVTGGAKDSQLRSQFGVGVCGFRPRYAVTGGCGQKQSLFFIDSLLKQSCANHSIAIRFRLTPFLLATLESIVDH